LKGSYQLAGLRDNSYEQHSHVARPAEKPQLYGIRRDLQNQRKAAPTIFWATLSDDSVLPSAFFQVTAFPSAMTRV
jgi:hypothetical protein